MSNKDQSICIVVNRNNIVHSLCLIMADENGKYKGRPLSDSGEREFYAKCRELDDTLPETIEEFEALDLQSEEFEDRNFPSFDDGYFEVDTQAVCLTWPDSV